MSEYSASEIKYKIVVQHNNVCCAKRDIRHTMVIEMLMMEKSEINSTVRLVVAESRQEEQNSRFGKI